MEWHSIAPISPDLPSLTPGSSATHKRESDKWDWLLECSVATKRSKQRWWNHDISSDCENIGRTMGRINSTTWLLVWTSRRWCKGEVYCYSGNVRRNLCPDEGYWSKRHVLDWTLSTRLTRVSWSGAAVNPLHVFFYLQRHAFTRMNDSFTRMLFEFLDRFVKALAHEPHYFISCCWAT